jgi:hypothetical protein
MKDILNLKTSLPTLSPERSPFDIVGRYFDYKRDTELIRLETIKVREQAEIIRKEIDARLKEELDRNNKKFQKEMLRLKTITKSLRDGRKSKKKILKELSKLIDYLANPNIPDAIKEQIPIMINSLTKILKQEKIYELEKIKELRDFDPNRKLLK